MAIKRPLKHIDTFAIAAIADVVFLLMILFAVISSFIFPTAVEVGLPEGISQTALKPSTEVYIDSANVIWLKSANVDSLPPHRVTHEELAAALMLSSHDGDVQEIEICADSTVNYSSVMKVIQLATANNFRPVLATRPPL